MQRTSPTEEYISPISDFFFTPEIIDKVFDVNNSDTSYQVLLVLRRVNTICAQGVDSYFNKILEGQHNPDEYPNQGFQILQGAVLNFKPHCLVTNQIPRYFKAIEIIQYGAATYFPIESSNKNFINCERPGYTNTLYAEIKFAPTLQKALTLYFHSRRNINSNLASKEFFTIFSSRMQHLMSSMQYCTITIGNSREYDPGPYSIQKKYFCIHFQHETVLINFNSSCSAFIFTQFLISKIANQRLFEILSVPKKKDIYSGLGSVTRNTYNCVHHHMIPYFNKYKDYEQVSKIITDFAEFCFQGLGNPNTLNNSLFYLNLFFVRGLIKKSFVDCFKLANICLSLLNSTDNDTLILTLEFLYTLIEKNSVENFGFDETINKLLDSKNNEIQLNAALIILILMEKGYIKELNTIHNKKLIKKISFLSENTDPNLKRIPSFPAIRKEFMEAVEKYILIEVSYENFDILYSKEKILFQLAKSNLLDKPFIISLLKNLKIDQLLSAGHTAYNEIITFLLFLSESKLLDEEIIINLNLIDLIINSKFSDEDSSIIYLFQKFPEITQNLLEVLNSTLIQQTQEDGPARRRVSGLLANLANKIDHDSLIKFNLVPAVVEHSLKRTPFLGDELSNIPWSTAESSGIRFLSLLAQNDMLEKEKLPEIIRKIFIELNFEYPEENTCYCSNAVKPFFQTLIEKQMINHSELVDLSLNYLATADDVRIKGNVIAFLSWSYIDETGSEEDSDDESIKLPPINESMNTRITQLLTGIQSDFPSESRIGKILAKLLDTPPDPD